MGRRLLLILLILIPTVVAADEPVTWEMAYSLKSRRPPRPKPSEPDAKRDNVGPFRLANEFDPPADRPEPQPAAMPQAYELADRWGQRWQHSDPAYLAQFVASRNASGGYELVGVQNGQFQFRPYRPPAYRGTAYCGPNGCPP